MLLRTGNIRRAIAHGNMTESMPRYSTVKERTLVKERIEEEATGEKTDRIPLWNAEYNVQCNQIRLPLNHLFLRLKNARTTDTQIALIESDGEFLDYIGDRIPAPEADTFDEDRQFEQASQDVQTVLLCIEANRRRENGKTLFETLKDEGWRPIEVPIITRSGVLINGNTRVAAIEAMLKDGQEIQGIDSANPQIDVRVVPNVGAGEEDIRQLENYLQKPDGVRLNYNWYQQTTIIRRRLSNNESQSSVQSDYKDLERFKTLAKMKKTLSARTVVDELFENIGKKNQAILMNPNEHMLYAMNEILSKDYVREDPGKSSQTKALFSHLLQVTLQGDPIGEMRYHITRIKNATDIQRFCDDINEILPGSFNVEQVDDGLGDNFSEWSFDHSVFPTADDSLKEDCANLIYEIAEELKARNAGLDEKNAVIKRLEEARKKISSSKEILSGIDGEYSREEELLVELSEIGRSIKEYLEWRTQR